MEQVKKQVESTLRNFFQTASNIYVDPETQECEVTVSIDEYQGELDGHYIENGVHLKMVDFCDTYPYKYVFSFTLKNKA